MRPLRERALVERARTSLFFVPSAFVVAGVVLGQLTIALDQRVDDGEGGLPLGLTSTVASARAVLSTIAGATITVAGIAFSISLLVIQLASSQYSPRVVHGLFRDPFNKRILGVVVGTFTFCLVILRSVRSSVEPGGDAVVPNIGVGLAVLFGIASILAVIAFINHNAHAMDVSEILDVVTTETLDAVDATWPEPDTGEPADGLDRSDAEPWATPALDAGADPLRVTFDRNGWIQLLDDAALVAAVPEHSTVRFESSVGRYAIRGTPMCTIWPAPTDPDSVTAGVRDAVHIGKTRTLTQDPLYGVRQLVDVALKALSPGVNDPTTAQDAIFHLGAVLAELIRRDPPPSGRSTRGRVLLAAQSPDHAEVFELAFAELRMSAASSPTVCVYLLELLRQLADLADPGTERARSVVQLLRGHARQTLENAEHADLPAAELGRVAQAYTDRFGWTTIA